MALLGIAMRNGSLDAPMQDAAMLSANAGDPGIADRWKALAYAMQAHSLNMLAESRKPPRKNPSMHSAPAAKGKWMPGARTMRGPCA